MIACLNPAFLSLHLSSALPPIPCLSEQTASRWHDAMYYPGSFFQQLWADTLKYSKAKAELYCGGAANCINVEVGSGTGDILLGMADAFHYSIGLDINEEFLKYSRSQVTKEVADKVSFIQGSATELRELVNAKLTEVKGTSGKVKKPVVVTCVNNTLGVFPDAIKPATYKEMKQLAGPDGIVIVGFWNAHKFGDGLQHFYAANPQLCGTMEGASIDWKDHTMTTAGGYRTHWTTPFEAARVLKEYGFEVVDVTEIGVGVLCTCRRGGEELLNRSGSSANMAKLEAEAKRCEDNTISFYNDGFSLSFYREVWAQGKCRHIGLWDDDFADVNIDDAMVRESCEAATRKLFEMVPNDRGSRAIEFGSGFGGSARFAAGQLGMSVRCVDVSSKANEINRGVVAEAGLEDKISIIERSFFNTGEQDSSFDIVFSQDALCHAEQATKAVLEASRVLKPGGYLACTTLTVDPAASQSELDNALKRLNLRALDSTDNLIKDATELGFRLVAFEDTSTSLIKHIGAIQKLVQERKQQLCQATSEDYTAGVVSGLKAWEKAANNGVLRWGYFVFCSELTEPQRTI
ncbi:unnamed protein product [Chrysoparadoxa australica]